MELRKQEIIESIRKFNNTSSEFPSDKTIADLFVEQAQSTPDNFAVIYGNKKLSFKELDTISNQFANYLIANHNITAKLSGVDRACSTNKSAIVLSLGNSEEVLLNFLIDSIISCFLNSII